MVGSNWYLTYTGVGSRQTPERVCELIRRIAARLETRGWHVRTGDAAGADRAFADGAVSLENVTVFAPWKRKEHDDRTVVLDGDIAARAHAIAKEIHPVWDALKWADKALHARNVPQVLGSTLEAPSRFLACWTEDGAETEEETSRRTGGTRTAIVVASRNGVPVYNLGRGGDAVQRMWNSIRQAEEDIAAGKAAGSGKPGHEQRAERG